MSIYLASTQAFINLYETGIISQESFNQVYQQIQDLEDDEDIAETIEVWLESPNNSQLLKAYKNQLRELTASTYLESGKTLGIGNTKSPTPVGEPNPTSRELLDNIMIKNKPSADDNSQSSSSST
ncbi:MAG: hypothetical protein WAN66_19400 [Limnoraphis robusta]|uniref:Uncharacterized protein n=1 Tax=Limnoraphis robusta CS-951 TaxID=1637645 RepID=A0A0F5YLF1_9CYAN|nr:hypothetical protein [Limnoraphis robusta]KKD39497.1 hypothetical protein WN50_03075 [Limnoraphis robusta CS-951]